MSLSDHRANLCVLLLTASHNHATHFRFNISLLQSIDFGIQFRKGLKEFLSINKGSVSDARILWDATKGFIRNNSIAFASGHNRRQLEEMNNLGHHLCSLIQQQHNSFSVEMEKELSMIIMKFNSLLRQRSEFLINRVRQPHCLDGSKPSFLLAGELRNNECLHLQYKPRVAQFYMTSTDKSTI